MEDGGDRGVVARLGDVEVMLVADRPGAVEALALLDASGSTDTAPLVDEAERVRLEELAEGRDVAGHRAVVARRSGEPAGYAGLVLEDDGSGTVDLAAPDDADAAVAALDAVESLARAEGAGTLQVWARRATEDDVRRLLDRGYVEARRLAVLARPLSRAPEQSPTPDGVVIRTYRPDQDDAAVVDVLARAYAGTAEAGWDLEGFRERRRYDWFDPDDLLLAVAADGAVAGIHWTKRRGPTVGEVYNLAVAPSAQGHRLGPALLTAGLRHLHRRGIREVLLWVDAANQRAVRLYEAQGFVTRWEDVAVTRSLG